MISATRVLLTALLARSSDRFKQARGKDLDSASAALTEVHDKLCLAMRVKFYGGLANFFNLAGKDMQEDKAYGQEAAAALDAIVVTPLVDVKIELIMSDKQFDDLKYWATCNSDLAKPIATAMKALHALNTSTSRIQAF